MVNVEAGSVVTEVEMESEMEVDTTSEAPKRVAVGEGAQAIGDDGAVFAPSLSTMAEGKESEAGIGNELDRVD